MIEEGFELVIDTLVDGIKLIPFLLITYLIMEYMEHKTNEKTKQMIQKSGRFGPFIGGILGIFPQCGFSAAAANLYAVRIITLGTLIAIFLSTSDEMLPILLSQAAPIEVIIKILGIKLVIGVMLGFLVDLVTGKLQEKTKKTIGSIGDMCEKEHCHCEEGIIKPALIHTIHIFLYILLVTLLLNIVIQFVGEENVSNAISNQPVLGPILAGIIGLIPNCASSVILTKLYLSGVINVATMLSGLFVGAGVGILVLFKTNPSLKENISIVILLYLLGVISGMGIQALGIVI